MANGQAIGTGFSSCSLFQQGDALKLLMLK
jgi:hypothetical protein